MLEDLAPVGADLTVNLGDCVTAPLWPVETFQRLRSLGIPTVRGNHDRVLSDARTREGNALVAWTARQLGAAACDELLALPPSLTLDNGDVLAVHGRPGDDVSYLLEDMVDGRLARASRPLLHDRLSGVTASLLLCGHSHVQHTAAVGRCLVVNPGSVGSPRYAGNARWQDAEPSSPHARYAVATRRRGAWSVTMHVVAYDWSCVAAQARANGFPDWAAAFLGDDSASLHRPQ